MKTSSIYRYLLLLFLGAQYPGTVSALQYHAPQSDAVKHADTITILPLVFSEHQRPDDMQERMDSLYGELDEYIYKALLRKLALKGYVLDRPRQWSPPDKWSVEVLQGLSPEELAELSPESATYAAFLFVEFIHASNLKIESSASTAVSAVILHRPTGEVIWQNTSTGKFSENFFVILATGGLGMLLTPDKHAAIENAFKTLFEDLPEKEYQ
ncbi:MAG: hypothetical protein WBO34_05565 [Gammaproteobacteria bacterium]